MGYVSVCFKVLGKAKLRGELLQALRPYTTDLKKIVLHQKGSYMLSGADYSLGKVWPVSFDCHLQGLVTGVDGKGLKVKRSKPGTHR